VEELGKFVEPLGKRAQGADAEEAAPGLHPPLEGLQVDEVVERPVELHRAAAQRGAEVEREREVHEEDAEAHAHDEGEERVRDEPLDQQPQPGIEQEVVARRQKPPE
jgi:ribosomal protein L12E/L44/L45/RPP1/RPP2